MARKAFPLTLLITVLLGFFAISYSPLASDRQFIRHVVPPVLLVTAHPDDEVMFFAPSILSLVSHRIDLRVLCLSTGDSEGLGTTRKEEFFHSLSVLGVSAEKVFILDEPNLKDNFTKRWDAMTIAHSVLPIATGNDIGTVITFDPYGISGHPNHASLPLGIASLRALMMEKNLVTNFKLLMLVSRNRILKYTGPLNIPSMELQSRLGYPGYLTAFISWNGYLTAYQAMLEHKSQLLWFRYIYLVFSRYMYINEWEELS